MNLSFGGLPRPMKKPKARATAKQITPTATYVSAVVRDKAGPPRFTVDEYSSLLRALKTIFETVEYDDKTPLPSYSTLVDIEPVYSSLSPS